MNDCETVTVPIARARRRNQLHSPLDPKANPLARELSYIFQVQKVNVKTPILFINSDNKRFLIVRLARRGNQQPFLRAMFTEARNF